MIKTRRDLVFYIKEDYKRNLGKTSWFGLLLKMLYGHDSYMAYRYLKTLRHYEFYVNNHNKMPWVVLFRAYYKIRLQHLGNRYNLRIGPNMVGYGLRLPHVIGGGIIINCESMGNYCSVNVGVVIGNKNGQQNRPIIGDDCSFSVGCKVIGAIKLGKNVIVAPNSVVIKDVPDNAVVSGVPANIIKWRESQS